MIRISPIRLIGADNEQIGVVETHEALRMAEAKGLDLVEIVPDSRPPVCKIMDYGKYKYELSQKERKNNAKSKRMEIKEIRLGRSVKIDPHDVQIRVDQARRFLIAGHKVQITQRFRGREMMHRQLGLERLAEIVEQLSDVAKVESPPRWLGRAASLMLAPDKAKIEVYKHKLEKEKAEALAAGKALKEEESLAELEAKVEAQNRLEEIEDDDSAVDAANASEASQRSNKAKNEAQKREQKEKRKGPKDNRARNPVDDELKELLG